MVVCTSANQFSLLSYFESLVDLSQLFAGFGAKVLPLVSSFIELIGKIAFVVLIIPWAGYKGVILCEPPYLGCHDHSTVLLTVPSSFDKRRQGYLGNKSTIIARFAK